MWNKAPISEEIWARFPISAQLAIMAIIIGFSAGLALGVVSALNHDTWIDNVARVIAINQLAIPSFWQGLMIILFTVRLFNWMPPLGYHPIWQDPVISLKQLIFPAAVVGSNLMAIVARMTRSTMLEVMREDYVRTARAKGLTNRVVIVRHIMRNAMIPVVTIVSLSFGGLLNGTVVMETVFSVPGLGLYLIQAIVVRDYTVTQALVFFFAAIFIAINLMVDIMYGWLDPRISRH
ncbi:MAG: ABC transporter permease [Chloroflexi bacterium]|nr:ABC transporter permease [Chloroflexota bacterium]